MSTPTIDETFVLRTHLALLDLKADADRIRRNLPDRHVCGDTYPCRSCADLRVIHLRVDDHLNQLDEYAAGH